MSAPQNGLIWAPTAAHARVQIGGSSRDHSRTVDHALRSPAGRGAQAYHPQRVARDVPASHSLGSVIPQHSWRSPLRRSARAARPRGRRGCGGRASAGSPPPPRHTPRARPRACRVGARVDDQRHPSLPSAITNLIRISTPSQTTVQEKHASPSTTCGPVVCSIAPHPEVRRR
jgi:hypothetical protein